MEPCTWIDASRLACPLPIVRLALAVKELRPGERAGVIATDPAIQADLPAWCASTGNALISMEEESGRWLGIVERR